MNAVCACSFWRAWGWVAPLSCGVFLGGACPAWLASPLLLHVLCAAPSRGQVSIMQVGHCQDIYVILGLTVLHWASRVVRASIDQHHRETQQPQLSLHSNA